MENPNAKEQGLPVISVCMAAFNGEKYLVEQMESILCQLSPEDELIISDDGSSDGTITILQSYACDHANIKIIKGPQQGVIKNFEHAINEAKGSIIFLCDQDDKWEPNKVKKVLECFEEENCFVVVHDARIIDENNNEIEPSFFAYRNSGKGFIRNLVKNSYIGCCMAFRAEMKQLVLPFPTKIPMHDWWIGMLSEVGDHSLFIPDRLIDYRRHENNVSSFEHLSVPKMISNRACLFISFVLRMIKLAGVKH